MKKLLYGLFVGFLLTACESGNPNEDDGKELPRIAIAGLHIESNAFSPARTHEEAFHPRTGDEILDSYPFLAPGSVDRERAHWIPTLRGRALPGGIVTRDAYESLVTKTLELLRDNGSYDGLFFDIHGAMSVEGLDDPEGDFIERIREVNRKKYNHLDLHGFAWQRVVAPGATFRPDHLLPNGPA